MKSISALSLALIGTHAVKVDVNNLQSVDNYGSVYEPEHPDMELIVSDFGGAAPNLQHHHHRHSHKDNTEAKVAVVQKSAKMSKTVPIVAQRAQKKHVAAAQEDEDNEVGDPSDYDKAEPLNNEDIDSYTSSIIAEKNGRSISQMMAQDDEQKKQAEFERKQQLAKEATDLANSLKIKKVVAPVKTDADDVLEMMQKMSPEESDEDAAERENMEKQEAKLKQQKQKEDKAVAKKAADEAAKVAAVAKKEAAEQQARLVQAEKEEREAEKPEPTPKVEIKHASIATSPYAKAISTAETDSNESSELEQQKAKSAAAQKERAETEEVAEITPAPVVQKKQIQAPPVDEPKQRVRILNFDEDDQFATVKTDVHQGDDSTWGTAAVSEATNESLDDLADKAEFQTKLINEQKFLAAHTAPSLAQASKKKKPITFQDVQKSVRKSQSAQNKVISEEQQWIQNRVSKSNQEKLDEEMQEVDENYDYDSSMLGKSWF